MNCDGRPMAAKFTSACGGARAWACEPVRDCSRIRRDLAPHHAPGLQIGASRSSACGVSIGAPAWATLQAEQQPSWARGWPDGSVWPEVAPPSSWQMEARCNGSDAPMLAAQHATIGAKTCTARATRTIGRNFRNRRRISKSIPFNVLANHAQSRVSRLGSRQTDVEHGEIRIYAAASDEVPDCRWSCRRSVCPPPTPLPGHCGAQNQRTQMAKSQSFRKLLEF